MHEEWDDLQGQLIHVRIFSVNSSNAEDIIIKGEMVDGPQEGLYFDIHVDTTPEDKG